MQEHIQAYTHDHTDTQDIAKLQMLRECISHLIFSLTSSTDEQMLNYEIYQSWGGGVLVSMNQCTNFNQIQDMTSLAPNLLVVVKIIIHIRLSNYSGQWNISETICQSMSTEILAAICMVAWCVAKHIHFRLCVIYRCKRVLLWYIQYDTRWHTALQ